MCRRSGCRGRDVGSMGLGGSPFLQWERVAYSDGSSLSGWVDYSSGTTGWSVDGGYLTTGLTSLALGAEIAPTCSHAGASDYPLKPPVAPIMYFGCKARWPSGGFAGKQTKLVLSSGTQETYYSTGLARGASSIGYVLRHTYGASGGSWSPALSGLAEDTDIEVGILVVGLQSVHAFVNGELVDSMELSGSSYGLGTAVLNLRPLNDNAAGRDRTSLFEVGLDNSDNPGIGKELRIRQLSLWRASFALPGF